MFFRTRHRYSTCFLLLNCPLFSHWCFTHQYKNTTQFCFYAVPAASQNTKASKIGHTHDDRYYTETEINSKLKMISQKNPITVNTSCVSKLESSYVFRCCGWIFGLFDVTLTSTCTATYTAYLLGTIIQDYRPSANHGCLTVVATDGKDGNGNPWVNLNTNGELYLNVRNTPLSGTRNYIYFIVPGIEHSLINMLNVLCLYSSQSNGCNPCRYRDIGTTCLSNTTFCSKFVAYRYYLCYGNTYCDVR